MQYNDQKRKLKWRRTQRVVLYYGHMFVYMLQWLWMFRLGLSGTVGTNSLPLTNQWTASRNFVISNQSAYAPLVKCHAIAEFQDLSPVFLIIQYHIIRVVSDVCFRTQCIRLLNCLFRAFYKNTMDVNVWELKCEI